MCEKCIARSMPLPEGPMYAMLSNGTVVITGEFFTWITFWFAGAKPANWEPEVC